MILAGGFASCGPLSNEEAVAIHELLHAWISYKKLTGDGEKDGDDMVNGLELAIHDYIDYLQAVAAGNAPAPRPPRWRSSTTCSV